MAPPVNPALPDTQPPAEARGWTQKYKDNTVSVLDTYRLKLDVTRKVVLVVCLMCGANLFCCNLSNVQSQHDKHCKQRPAAEQPPPLPNPTGKQVHPDDQQLSDKYVALFVATTGTPHAALKNKFLKKAFRVLGATCPSPKRVKTLIRDVYLETRHTVEADLSSLFEVGMAGMMCTDGWRHRNAAQGHPLLNLVLLKPSSGVWFYDCYPLDRGAKRDACFYADMHNDMANKVQLIAKVLGNCGKIRNAFNCAQMIKYQKIHAVLKIWDDLVAHAKNWVSELGHPGGLDKVDASFVHGVLRIFKDRAVKHCQPVMAAARLLDPINFFDMGEHAQPVPPLTGSARRAFWKLQAAPQFPILAKAAERLLSAHASTAAAERNWSVWGHTYHNALRNNLSVEAAKREVYLKANVPTTDSDDEAQTVQDTLIDIINTDWDVRVTGQSEGTTPELAEPAGAPPQQQQQLAAASTSHKREAPAANKSRATKQGATHNSVAKRASAARLACGEIA
ncbi:hypothetical protein QJQ45_018466 [Haematococcus lacustris]|nr:hypothetical protein QJQ45_018466 [Haematococcus lacustris]